MSALNRYLFRTLRLGRGAMPIAVGLPYAEKVLSYSPIAYWQLNETSGTAAVCSVNAAQNGTYARNVTTMGTGTGIGDGNTAPDFDGTNDSVDIYSTTFRDAFDGVKGTVSIWAKVYHVNLWTDGLTKRVIEIRADAQNYIEIFRTPAASNSLRFAYEAGDERENQDEAGLSLITWMHLAITWAKSPEKFGAYLNGSLLLDNQDVGVWAAVKPSETQTVIGAADNANQLAWHGWLSNFAVFDSDLGDTAIADLASV